MEFAAVLRLCWSEFLLSAEITSRRFCGYYSIQDTMTSLQPKAAGVDCTLLSATASGSVSRVSRDCGQQDVRRVPKCFLQPEIGREVQPQMVPRRAGKWRKVGVKVFQCLVSITERKWLTHSSQVRRRNVCGRFMRCFPGIVPSNSVDSSSRMIHVLDSENLQLINCR